MNQLPDTCERRGEGRDPTLKSFPARIGLADTLSVTPLLRALGREQ